MDVRFAKAILGHASLATTDRYYLAFEDEKLRDATIIIGDLHRRGPLMENAD
jgi:integrase